MKTIADRTERYAAIINAFRAAAQAAVAADPGDDNDGGTCNMDCPVVSLPGMAEKTVARLAEEAGINAYAIRWTSSRWFVVGVSLRGQANQRSKMAEAATKALIDCGLKAATYYQMD